MKSWRVSGLWAIALAVSLSQILASVETREQREVRMAEQSILSSIAVSASPKGHDLCASTPLACVGANKAELGLALIGARETPLSVAALVRVLRFRTDGSLTQDCDCYVLNHVSLSRTYLKRLKPEELERQCLGEVARLVANDRESFEGLDPRAVCATPEKIRQRVSELASAINAGHRCGAEDF